MADVTKYSNKFAASTSVTAFPWNVRGHSRMRGTCSRLESALETGGPLIRVQSSERTKLGDFDAKRPAFKTTERT